MTEWESEGNAFGLTEGLIYIWWNPKMSAKKDFSADPPVLVPAVGEWLAAHPDVRYYPEPMVGPPMWIFPSHDLREEFKGLFLETRERMEEIIAEALVEKTAVETKLWYAQGKPRRDGRAYVTKRMSRFHGEPEEDIDIIIRDPETGKYL